MRVLITGASRGIGLETTKIFLDNDFFVLGTSTSGKIPISHNNLKTIKLDFLSPDSINAAEKELAEKKIDILIVTGGYMSVPFCIAAKIFNIKIYLFEPNMVIGRANKFLIKFCTKLFCYSDKIINFPKDSKEKIFVINHVLRKEIYNFNNFNKEAINNIIKLLIVGGSQGAKFYDQNLKSKISFEDVLVYATGAYFGRTNIFLEKVKAMAGLDVLIIKFNKDLCDPYYASLYLNSDIGKLISMQYFTGSAQEHLYNHHLENYKIFIPKNKHYEKST